MQKSHMTLFYYLAGRLDLEKLNGCVAVIIYHNPKCRVNNHADMINLVRLIFGLKAFSAKLTRSRLNWLQTPANVVLESLGHFLETLS